MTQPSPSDQELLQRLLAGDEPAFTELFHRHKGAVYRFAFHMSGSRTIAEEVTQETFLALLRNAGRFDPDRGSVAAFLCGIARNQVFRWLDRERSWRLNAPAESLAESQGTDTIAAATGPPGPLEGLLRGEAIEAVRQAVLALPAHYREAIVLCDLEEMDYGEAAAALGCSIGTVRSRLHRARRLLIEKLRAAGQPGLAPGRIRPAGCTP